MEQAQVSKTEQLNSMALEIIAANPKCILSGSLALKLQGHSLRREPKDIDLYTPFASSFQALEGMKVVADFNDEDYENEYYERSCYKYKDVSIDVFTPVDEHVPELLTIAEYASGNRYPVVKDFQIISLKASHAFGKSFTKWKHKDDIIHLMANL